MPEAAPRSADGRFVHIDCLRGVAALMVVLHHFINESLLKTGAGGPVADALHSVLYDYIDLGRLGVLLFFLLSGYCIANSILRPARHPVAGFAINRVLRIFPAYWLSIAAAAILYGAYFPTDVYLVNLSLMQGFLYKPHVIGVYWTLPIELGFYGLCIVLFLLGLQRNLRHVQLICGLFFGYTVLASILRYATGIPFPYGLPFFLSLMLGGAVLRRMDDLNLDTVRFIRFAAPIAVAGMFVTAVCVYADPAAYEKTWYREFIPSVTALAVFLLFVYGYRPRSKVFAYLGRISYSLYLFHSLVFDAMIRTMPKVVALGPFWMVAVLLAVVIVVASMTYAAVERPGIRAGRHLVDALNGWRPRIETAR